MLAGPTGRLYIWWDFADRGDAMTLLTLDRLPASGSPSSFSPFAVSMLSQRCGISTRHKPLVAAFCSVGLEVFSLFQFK